VVPYLQSGTAVKEECLIAQAFCYLGNLASGTRHCLLLIRHPFRGLEAAFVPTWLPELCCNWRTWECLERRHLLGSDRHCRHRLISMMPLYLYVHFRLSVWWLLFVDVAEAAGETCSGCSPAIPTPSVKSLCSPGKASGSRAGSTCQKSGGKTTYALVRTGEMPLISKLLQCIVANSTAIKCDMIFACITYIFNGKSYWLQDNLNRTDRKSCTKTVKHVGRNSPFL